MASPPANKRISSTTSVDLRSSVFGLEALGVTHPSKRLRHVVLFKFKEEITAHEIEEVVATFAELPNKITAIEDFESGTDVSVENRAQGYTHCFLVSFRDHLSAASGPSRIRQARSASIRQSAGLRLLVGLSNENSISWETEEP